MWYEKSYRRNLVDMHIEDWNPEFLSEFSPDEYYGNLVRGKIQSPMIYLQSHAGHCYWPTETGHVHSALKGREDAVKRLIDKCRAGGMDVVGYYSLIFNTYEEDRRPEWKIHDGSGKSQRDNGGRYGLCCPNNMEYRAFVFAQINEIAEYFPLDGMFYDMLFWPDICRCDSCRARFDREVGGVIPAEVNWHDAKWIAFANKRSEWMGEFAAAVTAETRRVMPGVSVEHNYSSGVTGDWFQAADETVSDACDYTGGDLYGDLYNHSFTCKYYMGITKNQPFEYMTCRCDSYLSQHTVTKTKEALELEIMLTCAHHGASFIIDAIDPKGTMDSRVYDRIGEIFEKHIAYEKYLTGDYVADVGVYYSTSSRFNPDGGEFTNKDCAVNTVRTLIENHIPVGVVSNANGCAEALSGYKFIFAPWLCNTKDAMTEKLIEYVKNGGNLYFSGAGNERLLNELAGVRYTGKMTKETRTYAAPLKEYEHLFGEFNDDFPMPFECALPIVEVEIGNGNGKTAAYITLPYTARSERRFASIHSDPPGIRTKHPALVIRKYGKGNVIWSAAPIENDARGHYRKLLMNLMGLFMDKNSLSVRTNAAKNVELVTFKTGNGYLMSAADLRCTEELIPVRAFDVWIKTGEPVKGVVKLPERTPVGFVYSDGVVGFNAGELIMFAMFEVETE